MHESVVRKIVAEALMLIMFLCTATAYGGNANAPSPCEIAYPSDRTVEWTCYTLKKKDSLESLFGDRWQDVARFNRIDRRHALPGVSLKVPKSLKDIEDFSPLPTELDYSWSEGERKLVLVDLTEQFLGAYEDGRRVLSFPVASGKSDFITPPGEFRITAFSRNHASSLFTIEATDIPYPMHYALRFFVSSEDVAYYIHGRDLPGYPASHGCVGLYDEDMQKEYYGIPEYPLVDSARKLYEWAIGPHPDDGELNYLKNGPRVLIVGEPPGGATRTGNPAPGP